VCCNSFYFELGEHELVLVCLVRGDMDVLAADGPDGGLRRLYHISGHTGRPSHIDCCPASHHDLFDGSGDGEGVWRSLLLIGASGDALALHRVTVDGAEEIKRIPNRLR